MRLANQKSKSNQQYVTARDGERVRNIAYKGPQRSVTPTVQRSTAATTATVMSDLEHSDQREALDPNDPFLTDEERSEVQGKLDRMLPPEVTVAKRVVSKVKRKLGGNKHKGTTTPSSGSAMWDKTIDRYAHINIGRG